MVVGVLLRNMLRRRSIRWHCRVERREGKMQLGRLVSGVLRGRGLYGGSADF